MNADFDLDKYLRHSKKVDISDLDLSQAANHPVTADEIHALTYMTDIESHTVVYLRAILNTCAIEDPETTAFLSCWAYEEFHHGHTLRQLLNALGVPVTHDRIAEVQQAASWGEWIKEMGSSLICRMTRHFHGAYLTYGAISELSTLEGYGILARRTQNPIVAEVMRRLAKDERRHFSFYYNKARRELEPRNAQRLTSFVIRNFWLPVGGGVKPDSEVEWILSFILGDPEGVEIARRIDETIAKLPGMQWFDRLSVSRQDAIDRRAKSRANTSAVGLGQPQRTPAMAKAATGSGGD